MPAQFDGSGNANDLNSSFTGFNIATNGITIMGWARQDNTTDNTFMTPFEIAGTTSHFLYVQETAGNIDAYMDGQGTGTSVSLHAADTGSWYFYALVKEAGNNTVQVYHRALTALTLTNNSMSNNGSSTITVDHIQIGQSVFADEGWTGAVAAVKYWDRPLTAAEILTESFTYLPHRFADLQSIYPLLVDQDWSDYGPAGNDLTEAGTVTHTSEGPPISWAAAGPRLFVPTPVSAAVYPPFPRRQNTLVRM